MKVLLTGFESFAGVAVNPSQQVVEHLAGQAVHPEIKLITAVLPVEYDASGKQLLKLIHTHQPDGIIMLGVARERRMISLERVALNIDDSPTPDNANVYRDGFPIIWQTSPIAYLSTLPIIPMQEALQQSGIPSHISNHAGTYVCNHVFYIASHEYERMNQYIPLGFIHLPPVSQDYPLEMMIGGVEICLNVLWEASN